MTYIWTVEVDAWYPPGSTVLTGHYADGIGLITSPTDTPANVSYEPRLVQPALLQRDAFDSRTTMGKSRVGYGDAVLNNADGGLDGYISLGFDGRRVIVRRGHPGGAYPGSYMTVLSATMQQAIFDVKHVTLKLRDQQQLLAVPLQTTKYAGSNVLPAGLEGVDDLKGKPKPVCYGTVFNISPPCVNTSKLIYQVNDGAIHAIGEIRDRGVPLLSQLYLLGAGNGVTSYIYTSPNGIAWTRHSSGFGASSVYALGFGGGVLVAGGGTGGGGTASLLASSPDGVTWTGQTSPFGNSTVRSFAYGGGVFVAGDDTGQIATSPDGATWTLQTSGFTGTPMIRSITYNGTVFIAVAASQIRTSPNGVTWSARSTAHGGSTMMAVGYAADLGLSVIVGDSGKISSSPDGITWTLRATIAGATFTSVAYGNSQFIAIDQNVGYAATSADGLSWMVTGNLAQVNAAAIGQGLAYGNGQFLIAGPGATAYAVRTVDSAHAARTGDYGAFSSDLLYSTCYVSGIAAAGTYANTTDLLDDTLAPPPGFYKVCPTTGYFRLGSRPEGTITCDVTQGASSSDRTAGQDFTAIVQRAGLSSSYWNAGDITTLDGAVSATLGFWTDQDTTCADAIDLVSASVGAWWAADSAGVFRIKQLAAPSGSPVVTFTRDALLRPLEQVQSNDPGAGVPTYQSVVRYAKNYTVQTPTDVAGAVSNTNRARFAVEWMDASTTDSTVLTAHPLSAPIIEESLLTNAADAGTESARRQTLRGVFRQWYELTVEMTDTNMALELGDVISLSYPRFGLSGGKLLRVLGIQPDAQTNTMVLSAWG